MMATASAIGSLGNTKFQVAQDNTSSLLPGLSYDSSNVLKKASTQFNHTEGDLLYSEGELATGVYIVRSGKIKLTANSSDGKSLILRIARAGDVIGLSSALSERTNDTTAEVVEPTVVSYIKTANLYQLMEHNGELALRIAQELSLEYSGLCQELSALGLQRSAVSRLAKLLTGLAENVAPQNGKVAVPCPHTHEEMAQMIGTSRETVTRLLHDMRDQGTLLLKNDVLTINNVNALRALAN
jgi:CRP/FNR family transcriptional regulator, cyclic AMP receptor protein